MPKDVRKADEYHRKTLQSKYVRTYCPGDVKKVIMLIRERGSKTGDSILGWAYEHGMGVPRIGKEAVKYYNRAADKGSIFALQRLKELGYKRRA